MPTSSKNRKIARNVTPASLSRPSPPSPKANGTVLILAPGKSLMRPPNRWLKINSNGKMSKTMRMRLMPKTLFYDRFVYIEVNLLITEHSLVWPPSTPTIWPSGCPWHE